MNVHASSLAILMVLSLTLAIPAEDKVTNLPAKVENMAIAQGGRSIVLKLAEESGLRIYDVTTQTLRNLELGFEKFVFGAGGQKIVVFSPVTNAVTVYDLSTLKPVQERSFFDNVSIDKIVMGTERDDLAFVTMRSDIENPGSFLSKMFDLKRMSVLSPKMSGEATQQRPKFDDSLFHLRIGPDLRIITSWRPGTSPSGITIWKQISGAYAFASAHDSADYLAVGSDDRIYTGYGVIYEFPTASSEFGRRSPVEVGRIPQRSLFPSATGRFYLSLGLDSGLKLHQFGNTEPLCDLGEFPGKVFKVDESVHLPTNEPNFTPSRLESLRITPDYVNTRMTLDRRVTLVPAADSIVFIPYSNDRLVHRNLDIRRNMDGTGKDYCVVLSAPTLSAKAGTEWTYKIQAIAKNEPLTFSVQKGPRQMQVSKDGEVRWPIESGISGNTDIVIEIKDSEGNVTPHKFTISFN